MHHESAKDRWERVRAILEEVLEAKAENRAAILDARCAGDPGLRGEVEFLVAANDEVTAGGDFFGTVEDPERVGRYRIVRLIGRGGMGVVYLAEQVEPVRREVAVKLIQAGMNTREIVARFELERQALAILDHPHIAKVLDAGATETGRPFFVMEFCHGEPIDAYCDGNRLSLDERLELFGQVCSAVQHAHTKGIIHRDLKPGNVLVSTQDGKPHARVIDFGIAKATAGKLTHETLLTELRTMMGTPQYMSPEQAAGSQDVDTRTDVYSLGVMLYELLTGTTPFTREALRSAAHAEIHRIIREVEPTIPSARVTGTPDTISGVAANRRTDPGKLRTLLRGDLDWIVMKCLEKDRDRRYESANSLAMDLRRYLAREAVLAAPPSVSYRMKKFVRRHRVTFTAVATVVLIATVALAWQIRVAWRQQRLALLAGRVETMTSYAQWDVTNFTPELGRQITETLFKAGVPYSERSLLETAFREDWSGVGASDSVRAILDTAVLTPAATTIEHIHEVRLAHLWQLLARSYARLGLYDDAMPLQLAALAARRRALGAEHPETLTSISSMGNLLRDQGKLAEAEVYLRDALERRRRVLGGDDYFTLESANDLGVVLQAQGKLAEAEPYYREALEIGERTMGEAHPNRYIFVRCMASLLLARGDQRQAVESLLARETAARRALAGGDPHRLAMFLTVLGRARVGMGYDPERFRLAETNLLEAHPALVKARGEDHDDTLGCVQGLVDLYTHWGSAEPRKGYDTKAAHWRAKLRPKTAPL